MKIDSLTVTPMRLPLAKALNLRGGSASGFTNVIVKVVTSDGVVGYGESSPRPKLNGESTASVREIVENVLAPMLIGKELRGLAAITAAMSPVVGNASAKSAVEGAALDALARSLGVSCHVLLGGFTDRIRCSGLLPLGEPVEVTEKAIEMSETHGISDFKIKIGADLDRDIRTAELIRAQYPDAVLYADANGGYTPAEAAAFLRVAQDQRFTMVEEPIAMPGNDVRRRLTESTFVRIIGDESCTTEAQAMAALSAGACSGVSIKVARTGMVGSAGLRQHASTLGASVHIGYELVSSVGAAASLAFACASPVSCANPTEGVAFLELADDVVAERLPVIAGHLEVPEGSGFGVAVDEQAVKRLAVD